jgi:hypothetical protein
MLKIFLEYVGFSARTLLRGPSKRKGLDQWFSKWAVGPFGGGGGLPQGALSGAGAAGVG